MFSPRLGRYEVDENLIARFEVVGLSGFGDGSCRCNIAEEPKGLSGKTTSFHGVPAKFLSGFCVILLCKLDNLIPVVSVFFREVKVKHLNRLPLTPRFKRSDDMTG